MAESEPLWKACADWLCRLEVLPENHRILLPDANIEDLAYALRDGVLLCHVASTICPEAIDQRNVNQRPQFAQFLCLKNIRVFLTACRDGFNLAETDLFQPGMLYDFMDFARVLHTLSKLSHCSITIKKKPNIPGFPNIVNSVNSRTLANTNYGTDPEQPEEEIYRTLADQVDEDQYKDFYYQHHGGAVSYGHQGRGQGSQQYYMTIDQEEDIYEDLCAFKKDDSSKLDCEKFIPKEKRDYCLKELLETEAKYVEVLQMLRDFFIQSPILNFKDHDKEVIFMNIPQLIEFHQTFYSKISDYISKHIQQQTRRLSLGSLFCENKNEFLIYSVFCCDLPKAQMLLDTLCSKDESVRESVQTCEQAANEGRFRLRDLLAVPMQRVLKYHLILRELVNHTNPAHEDYSNLQSAYEAMLDVSEYINEVKRDSEQLQIINDIQASITDLPIAHGVALKDYGRLRKDAELKVQSHADQGKIKTRYVFVFDKVLLMCKSTRGDNYSFKDVLKLTDYKIQEASIHHVLEDHNARWTHAFMLVHVQNLNVYTFIARSLEDKDKWISAIGEAIDNAFPNQRHDSTHEAVMHTFEAPNTNCAYCGKLLKGLFYQGYRCHKCAKPMHKSCISLLPRCGAPDVPIRKLHHQLSNCSLTETNQTRTNNTDYVNTNIEDHTWYVGVMDRETAQSTLLPYPISTFLVRCRGNPINSSMHPGYAISLKTSEKDIKHMKLLDNLNDEYFLSDHRKFKSVAELVSYHSQHSLNESFKGLDTTLRFPIKELFIVEAIHSFDPEASSPSLDKNLLSLYVGERVVILDKLSETQGWWKACNSLHRIGYIPKSYVKILHDESPTFNAP